MRHRPIHPLLPIMIHYFTQQIQIAFIQKVEIAILDKVLGKGGCHALQAFRASRIVVFLKKFAML